MRHLVLFAGVLAVLLIAGCVYQPQSSGPSGESTILETGNGKRINAMYYEGGGKGIILLHMLGKDLTSWKHLIPELQSEGYSVIAIDFSGHGGSSGKWQSFRESDFLDMPADVRAAKEFLEGKGKRPFAIIGASIGANVGLVYATEEPQITSLVLLSPGLDYRGIKTESAAEAFSGRSLILVSKDDKYAYTSGQELGALMQESEFMALEGGRHGTDMLDSEVNSLIISWLRENF